MSDKQINEMFGLNISVELRDLKVDEYNPKPLEVGGGQNVG